MPPSVEQILAPFDDQPELVERIAHRTIKPPIAVVEPNPEWPQRFQETRARIQQALGADRIVGIEHTGSTSVPGLPAKDVIDIDLSVADVADEAAYVPPLRALGFTFLLREPHWHQHRFLAMDRPGAYHVNLHVWGPDCPEVARHCIFRDWLRKTPADVALYAQAKRAAALQTTTDDVMDYNRRKQDVLRAILDRAFRDLGYIA